MKLEWEWFTDVSVDGVNSRDYPDFVDAFFSEGFWKDGREMTDAELDQLAEDCPEELYEMAMDYYL